MSTGYAASPIFRKKARAESFIQTLLPYVAPTGDIQGLTEVRFGPLEGKEIPLNLDPTAIFRQIAFRFQLKNEYAGPALTGVLTWSGTAVGSILYTGVGTAFLSQLLPGRYVWYVDNTNTLRYVRVQQVLSDTQFIGADPIQAAATAQAFGLMQGRNIPTDWSTGQEEDWTASTYQNTGTVSVATGSNALTGVGTLFLSELVVGDKIKLYANDGRELYLIVASIASNTSATLRGYPAASATGKAYTRFYTTYADLAFQVSDAEGTSFGKPSVVQAVQGAFGSFDLQFALDGIAHRPYFLGRSGAILLKIQNLVNDARLVHGHVVGVRVLT